TRFSRDWSSDVCSSDLVDDAAVDHLPHRLPEDDGVADVVPEVVGVELRAFDESTQNGRVVGDRGASWGDATQAGQELSAQGIHRSEERRGGKEWKHEWT